MDKVSVNVRDDIDLLITEMGKTSQSRQLEREACRACEDHTANGICSYHIWKFRQSLKRMEALYRSRKRVAGE